MVRDITIDDSLFSIGVTLLSLDNQGLIQFWSLWGTLFFSINVAQVCLKFLDLISKQSFLSIICGWITPLKSHDYPFSWLKSILMIFFLLRIKIPTIVHGMTSHFLFCLELKHIISWVEQTSQWSSHLGSRLHTLVWMANKLIFPMMFFSLHLGINLLNTIKVSII